MNDEQTQPITDSTQTEPTSSEQTPATNETPTVAIIPGTLTIQEIRPGMTIRVHERIKDVSPKGEERQRIQIFEGMVLGIRGGGVSKTMTIRKETGGFGVEKIYPLNSPVVSKVELVKTAHVRRAKLSYLQDLHNRFSRKLKETWVKNG